MRAMMASASTLVRRARIGLSASWPQLRQAIQTAFAATIAYLVADYFALPQGYWAVMTAILVVQASIGASLGLALDRLLATLLGAAAGAALVALFGTAHLVAAASLFVAVLLLAFLASRRASLRLAPVTAAIVILSDPSHGEPLMAAAYRVVDIGLGSLVALATALLLFPSRAGTALSRHIAGMLPLIARHLDGSLRAALGEPRDNEALFDLNSRVRRALGAGDALAGEARTELAGRLADHADPEALLRTLRRLWNTAMMAARAARSPLPPPAAERLQPALSELRAALAAYLDGLATAFRDSCPPPDFAPLADTLDRFAAEIVALRRDGVTREMSADAVARLFTLVDAIEQLRQNLKDLADRCDDLQRGQRALVVHSAPAGTPAGPPPAA